MCMKKSIKYVQHFKLKQNNLQDVSYCYFFMLTENSMLKMFTLKNHWKHENPMENPHKYRLYSFIFNRSERNPGFKV